MNKKSLVLLSTVALTLTLGACSKSNSNSKSSSSSSTAAVETKNPSSVTHDGTAIEGGTLRYAIVSSSPLKGMLIDELSEDSTDTEVIGFIDESMFSYGSDRKLNNEGLASVSFDVDNKTATVTLNGKDYKWSDGEPVTIDDYIFAYEGVGHKDYTGVRYDSDFENIEGMEAYHSGEASTISGLEKLDDYSVKIHYKEMYPSMQLAGGSLCSYIMPKHIFKDIPVADWQSSDYVRGDKHVGLGAFKVKSIVQGESVTVERNPYYYKGAAKLDGAVLEVVSPENIVSEMKAGKYDIATMPSAQYSTYNNLDNITLLGAPASSYYYVGFHLGKYDKASGKNVYNPSSKMANKNLRQAMGYALDNDAVGQEVYNGLQRNPNSIIIPFFTDITDSSLEGFKYDPEKAKSLLDEAGYKDVNGDGLREDPSGNKFQITFATYTGSEAWQAVISQYMEWWKAVGLDVQFYTGRTLEGNAFYDKIQADEQDIDMFAAGWSTGYDPNPAGLFGESAAFNFERFVSDKGNEIMKKIASTEAFDESKNKAFYKEWQAYVKDEAFIIPVLTGDSTTAVNKRVKYYDVELGSTKSSLEKIQLTATTGSVSSK